MAEAVRASRGPGFAGGRPAADTASAQLLRALLARAPQLCLGYSKAEAAERAMRGLDPDYDKRRFGTSQLGVVAVVRARIHDDWARDYLAGHPDAVVLHLGCGLDARPHRLDPPATVDWYDVDYPEVIALRRRLLPSREHCTMIAASVTDPAWLESVPRGRPALMIAEGLIPYLTPAQVRELLTRVVDAFPTGRIQLETVPVWAQRTSKWDPTLRKYDARFHFGVNDPAALADWHPRLEFAEEAPLTDSPLLAKAPKGIRLAYRLMNLFPGMRKSMRQVRFEF